MDEYVAMTAGAGAGLIEQARTGFAQARDAASRSGTRKAR